MNKKNTIALIIFAIIFISGLVFYYFYQKNTNIYEPVSINFRNFQTSDSSLIKIFSITPLGKEIPINYSLVNNNWQTTDGSYSKSIILCFNDSIASKYKSIYVNFNNKNYIFSINNLEIFVNTSSEKQYILPPIIRSENSFFTKTKHVFSINISNFRGIIPIFLALFFLLSLFYFFIQLLFKHKKGSLNKAVIYKWIKTICFSAITAFSLFYGYLLAKYTLSCYITSVLFIVVSGLILWYLSMFLIKLIPALNKYSGKIKKIILISLIIWFCSESALRFLGFDKGYNETITSYYSSGFNKNFYKDSQNPHLFVHEKQVSFYDEKSEFKYKIQANFDGLRDTNHTIIKQKDEIRIICLGNSFTEGIGTPQDSTWPRLLENRLRKTYQEKITVFNAGISGSDPYFEYMLLKERLLKYKPDFVFLALQVTDFNFHRFRGGFERFTKDGYQYKKAPSWEKLYAVSYIFRFVLNNLLNYENKYLLSQTDYQKECVQANIDIINCIDLFYQLSLEHKFKLVVVFIDNRGNSRYDFLINKLNKEGTIPAIDLEYYNKNIEKLSEKDLESYYWKIDMHCNSKGYDLISKGIMWNLNKMGIIDSLIKSNINTE